MIRKPGNCAAPVITEDYELDTRTLSSVHRRAQPARVLLLGMTLTAH
jgi:hypothetical protein